MKKILFIFLVIIVFTAFCFAEMAIEQQQAITDGFDQSQHTLAASGKTRDDILRYGEMSMDMYGYLTDNNRDDYYMLGYCTGTLNNLRAYRNRVYHIDKQKHYVTFFSSKTQQYCAKTGLDIKDVIKLFNIKPKNVVIK
jgi:hypothetical protein